MAKVLKDRLAAAASDLKDINGHSARSKVIFGAETSCILFSVLICEILWLISTKSITRLVYQPSSVRETLDKSRLQNTGGAIQSLNFFMEILQ